MSIFKKYICSECSRAMSYLAKRFDNDKVLCKKCAGVLANVRLLKQSSYQGYLAIKEYQNKNYERLRKVFHETHSYRNIHLDTNGFLFYVGDRIDQNTIFLNVSRIESCRFNCSVSKGAVSFLGAVSCTISIYIRMRDPEIEYCYTLHDLAPTTYQDSEYHTDFWGDDYCIDTYSYARPTALTTFLEHFYGVCRRTGAEFNEYGRKINRFEEDEKLFEAMRRGIPVEEVTLPDILEELDKIIKDPQYGVTSCETERCAECPDNCETEKPEFCEPPIPFVSNREYISEQEYQEIMDFVQSEVSCAQDGQE